MSSVAVGVSLQIGLISATVRVESAMEAETSFNQICMGQPDQDPHPPAALKQPIQCPVCGPITDSTTIKKGKPSGDGFLVVDASEIAALKRENTEQYKKQITLGAHPREQFDLETQRGERLYYLVPDGQADMYALVLAIVKESPDYAVCGLWTPRTATSLFQLRVYEREGHEVLVLEQRVPSANLKPIPVTSGTADPVLLPLGKQFLTQVVKPLDMADYDDGYKAKVDALFSAQTVQAAYSPAPVATGSGKRNSADLAEALRASLAASAKTSTRIAKAPAKAPVKRAPRRKSA